MCGSRNNFAPFPGIMKIPTWWEVTAVFPSSVTPKMLRLIQGIRLPSSKNYTVHVGWRSMAMEKDWLFYTIIPNFPLPARVPPVMRPP